MKSIPSTSYRTFTPEERFRLILAAGGRNDDAERDRLVGASPRVARTLPDYYPFVEAFQEITLHSFMELLDLAAHFTEALAHADACEIYLSDDDPDEDDPDEGDADEGEMGEEGTNDGTDGPDTPDDQPAAEPPPADAGKPPTERRMLDTAFAAGFMLKTKAAGWTVFCNRLNVPPLLLWSVLPGYERLQRALALADHAAFDADEFQLWWEGVCRRMDPGGSKPALLRRRYTAEAEADATEAAFRERVKWWGG